MRDPMAGLEGGVAVITGAGSGIGEGLAREAAGQDMKVVLADIAEDRIEALARSIREAGGDALPVPTDVSDPKALDRLAETTYDTYGETTLLVNNAGVETLGYSWEMDADVWDKTLAINIHGAVHGVRAFAPRMIEAGKPAYIANTSSIGGLGIMPVQTSYIMSKHAVLAFSECLYLEMQLKQAPIQVSVVLPGPVATRIFDDSQGTSDDASVHNHRQAMQSMMSSNGITGEEAGKRILAQIAEGHFWVSTHPELTEQYARARAAHLSELAPPFLSEELKASLGET